VKKFDIWGKTLVRTFLVLLFLSCTSSAIAALADLQGGAPEEASVTVTVNKPANAVNGLLTETRRFLYLEQPVSGPMTGTRQI